VSGVRACILIGALLLSAGRITPGSPPQLPDSSGPAASGRSDEGGGAKDPSSASSIVDSMMNEYQYIAENIDRIAPPAYRERKLALRWLQRRGYSEVLKELCARDGLGGLAEYVRMTLQIEYSMDHTPFFVRASKLKIEPLPMDWSFPVDPWGDRQVPARR
jgi:hypothetical protein